MTLETRSSSDMPPHRRLLARVAGLLLRPDLEWQVIQKEAETFSHLTKSYILPMSAIPALAMTAGILMIAGDQADQYSGLAFTIGALMFMQSVLVAYGLALLIKSVISKLAGLNRSYLVCLRAAAYTMTAVWVVGAALVFYPSRIYLVSLVGFAWSSYLFYIGSPRLLGIPTSKSFLITLVTMGGAVLVDSLASKIVGIVTGH